MQNDTNQSDPALCHMADCGTGRRPQEEIHYGNKEAVLDIGGTKKNTRIIFDHYMACMGIFFTDQAPKPFL